MVINIMPQTLKITSAAARTKQNSPQQKLWGKYKQMAVLCRKQCLILGDNKSSKGFLELMPCSSKKHYFFSKRNYIEFKQRLESTRIYVECSYVPGCQIISTCLKRKKKGTVKKSSVNPKSSNLGNIKRNGHSSIKNPKGLFCPVSEPQCPQLQLSPLL